MNNKKRNSLEELEIKRHSLSHLMTMAVLELYPKTGLGVGTPIEDGFYQDYDLPEKISDDILSKLEKRVKELIKGKIDFVQTKVSFANALKFYKDDPYKTELINDVKKKGEKTAFFFDSGDLHNLCKGPHVKNTSEIDPEAFKLTKLAGAYWRGDEKNKMLTRIYGIAFANKKELDKYLKMMVEAEKRDHKKLGQELDLFTFHEQAPGSAFWHPKGMVIWNELEKLGKNLREKYGSTEIQTPILAKRMLWEQSGHWQHYQDDMFNFKVGDENYVIKPMDCPFNILLYQEKQRSYRELPIRYSEIGRVFRNEKSGELNGLLRVQHITQDDAHIFVRPDQIEAEIVSLLKMVKEYYAIFNIKPKFFFADRPKDCMGKIISWDKAEVALKNALKKEKIKYGLKEKDGAFYGPKIDINMDDALGRSWQLATIQLDFQLSECFKLEYVDKNNQKKMPVIIHAAIFGSFERFIGILVEHYAGAFPVWLSPVQVKIISVGENHVKYCLKLAEEFRKNNIRAEVDDSDETVGNKIRKAVNEKTPYVLVIGDKEIKSNKLAVRDRGKRETREINKDDFISEVKKIIKEKK